MERLSKASRINLAFQAKQSNLKLSFRRLEQIYSVSRSTLSDRYHGAPDRTDTIPKLRRLTETDEKVIFERILDLDSRAFPVRLQHIEDMANLLLA